MQTTAAWVRIQRFAVTASYDNFTRAAEALGCRKERLSKQIGRIEADGAHAHRARRVTPTSDDAEQLWRGTRTGRQAHRRTVTSATHRKRISPNANGIAPQLAPECCDGLQVCWRFLVMSLRARRSQPNRHIGAHRGRHTQSGSIVLSVERKLHHAGASEAH